MIDHTGVIVSDFEKSKKFYSDALEPIGYTLLLEFPPSVTGGMNVAGFGEPPKRTSGSVRALRIIPGFTSRFESASARWWTYFIKPRLRPGEKITAPRACVHSTMQIITALSFSIRTATTSKRFVTKRRPSCRRGSKFQVQRSKLGWSSLPSNPNLDLLNLELQAEPVTLRQKP